MRPCFRRVYLARMCLVIGFMAICWFGTLEMRALFTPDEGRYAAIPQEMLASGDWITPRLNGLKYFEKPPLQYWLTAASFSLFGEDELTARLAPAVLGFLALLMVMYTGAKLYGVRAGALSALVLGSSWAFYLSSQFLTLDMTLAAFLTLALCSFMLAQRHAGAPGLERRWMAIAWLGTALAFLSKGLVALVLPGLTLTAYSLWTRDFNVWRRLRPLAGSVLFTLITAPWLIAIQLKNPEFFKLFFVQEHFSRFLEAGHSRPGAWWYYVPVLVLGAMPWTPLFVQRILDRKQRSPERDVAGATFSPSKFCAVWTIVTVVFFSASQSKLPAYIMPVFPALALLVGLWLRDLSARKIAVPAWTSLAMGIVLTLAFLNISAWNKFSALGADATKALPWLVVGAATLMASGVAGLALVSLRFRRSAVIAIATGTFAFWQSFFVFFQSVDQHFSSKRIVESAMKLTPIPPSAPIYSLQHLDNTVPFYFGHPVTLVQVRGELGRGIDAEPHKAIATMDAFEQRWITSADPAFAVMRTDTFVRLQANALPMVVLARDQRLVIVSRHAISPRELEKPMRARLGPA